MEDQFMSKKVKVVAILLAVMLAFSLAGCRRDGGRASGPIVLRLAETHAADYPTNQGNIALARLVEERTNGRIRIEIFAGGQLGDETAVIQELLLGTIDIGRVSAAPVAQFSPGINAIMLPFLYRDADHMWAVLNGPVGNNLLADLESAGLVGLTWFDSGARNFYTRMHLRTLDDFSGVRFRMMDSRLMMGIVEHLGGSGFAMGLGDVYGALQTGVIDGAENNLPAYEALSHFEVAPFLLLSGHLRVPELVIASRAVMSRLSAEDQAIIKQAAYEAQLIQRQEWDRFEGGVLERIQRDPRVTITSLSPPEWQRLSDAVAPLNVTFGAGHEALLAQIRNTR
jgi:tripartite ATP-independent transporter DctP family solute receptor